MISVQKCHFLAISEDWTNVYACCSFKLIVNHQCLVCIHCLDFALTIYVTKIRQFHVSQFWYWARPISPFMILDFCKVRKPINLWKWYFDFFGGVIKYAGFELQWGFPSLCRCSSVSEARKVFVYVNGGTDAAWGA